jgi:hypothetical protein
VAWKSTPLAVRARILKVRRLHLMLRVARRLAKHPTMGERWKARVPKFEAKLNELRVHSKKASGR